MAVLVSQQDKDKEQQEAPLAAPGSVGSGSAQTPGGVGGVPNNAPKGSGRFVNLQKYLGANQGAGQRLAGQIGENVGRQTQDVGKAVEDAQGVKGQIDSERNRIAQAGNFASQVAADPTKIAADQNQLAQFTQLRTGQTGLGDIQTQAQQKFGAAQSQLGNLQNLANMTGSEAGRFQLLSQALGRPSYNTGQQRLDQLMLQAEGGNTLGQLQRSTAEQALASQKAFDQAQSGVQESLGQTSEQAKAAQAQIMAALGGIDNPATQENEAAGAFGNLQSDLQARKQKFIDQNTGQQMDISRALAKAGAKETINPDVAKMLGLQAGQNLYNVDFASLVNPSFNAGNVTEQNIANQGDLSRYEALAKLAGTDPSYLNAQQAGTAQGLTVDPTKFQAELGRQGDLYNQFMGTQKNLAGNINHLMSSNAFYNIAKADPMTGQALLAMAAKDPSKYGLTTLDPNTKAGKGTVLAPPTPGMVEKPTQGGAPTTIPGGLSLDGISEASKNQLMKDYFGINENSITTPGLQQASGLLGAIGSRNPRLADQDYWQDTAAIDSWLKQYQGFNPSRKV